MRMICCWCRKCYDNKPSLAHSDNSQLDSHGICPKCASHFAQGGNRVSFHSWLDDINTPVLVVDHEGRTDRANKSARQFLGKDLPQIQGKLGGDVFECIYARQPEGCGKTEHCSTCDIRYAVETTFQTQEPQSGIRAVLYQELSDGTRKVLILTISTRVWFNLVLLKVDEITAED